MTLCINPRCPNPQNSDNAQFCQSCQSSLLLKQRYRAMKVLGRGGFGTTYEAYDLGNPNKVIKVLINNSPKAVELFQREAEVLSQLNNPGIPKVEPNSYIVFHPANSPEPVHCLVMEKVEGMNLRDYLKRLGHPIDSETADRWLRELVLILQAVHDRGILHRDIKPQNIIFKPDGRLNLIDFGAVREGTGTEVATATGSGGGTEVASHMAGGTSVVSRGYTAPEQVNGQAVKQSDFYSLGRTFVFLLTGKEPSEIPYDAHNDVLQWRKYASIVEPRLAELLDQMQSTLVSERPKNTQEILQKLQISSTTSSSHNTRIPSPSPIRGEDIEVQLKITAKEAERGTSKTVSFTRIVNINGKQQQETKQITFTIPQGAKDGQKLRLKEQGNVGKYGGDSGDVYVRLIVNQSVQSPPVPAAPLSASKLPLVLGLAVLVVV
jgi:serine/threonine protein kinase